MITKSETETTHYIGMSDDQIKDLRQFFDAFQAHDVAGIMKRTYDKAAPRITETLMSLKDAVQQCTLQK